MFVSFDGCKDVYVVQFVVDVCVFLDCFMDVSVSGIYTITCHIIRTMHVIHDHKQEGFSVPHFTTWP